MAAQPSPEPAAARPSLRLVEKTKLCHTCREQQPASSFVAPFGQRCAGCRKRVEESARCKVCRRPAGLTQSGGRRKVCDRPHCQRVSKQRATAKAIRVKRARIRARTHKECCACGVSKPLTAEHWSPMSRDRETGEVTRWDSYCKPCKAVDSRLRYASSPQRQQAARERAKRQREEEWKLRIADPEYDAAYRARWRAYSAAARLRQRQGPEEPSVRKRGGRLPSAPVAAYVDAFARRIAGPHALAGDDTHRRVCEQAQITDRQVTAWRSGEIRLAQLGVVDRVVTCLDALWWEIYDPEEFPGIFADRQRDDVLQWLDAVDAAARLFEGEGAFGSV